jgi:hypothetical protein
MQDFIKILIEMYIRASSLRKYELILVTGMMSAVTILVFLIGKDKLFLFLSQFEHLYNITSNQTLSFLLFIVTVMVAFLWIASILLEISWIERYYEKFMPPPPNGTILIATLVGSFMIVLAYISDNILNYSSCYLIFTLINWLSDTFSTNTVDKILAACYKNSDHISKDLVNEIRLYYIGRPKKLLGLFRVLVTIVAIGFSVLGQMYQVAYLLMISLLILNEVFHWTWRIRLYRRHKFVFV